MARTVTALLAVLSTLNFVLAQGYGRFPCSVNDKNGHIIPDQSLCSHDKLVAPGTAHGNDHNNQGDGITPRDSECVRQASTGADFCGIEGAKCATDSQCDNGKCLEGKCAGELGHACHGNDQLCLGFTYCNSALFDPGTTCGGIGSFCQDYTQGSPEFTDDHNYAIFNQFCSSGYCNTLTGECDTHGLAGDDCTTDPNYYCGPGLSCNGDFKCEAASVSEVSQAPTASASARARTRRSIKARHSLCPESHTACPLRAGGFECVDTHSSLEQCGACSGKGGVDCTTLPGVDAVTCVAGHCQISSCTSGHNWDRARNACVEAR